MNGALGDDRQEFIRDDECVKGKTKTAWIGKLKPFHLRSPPPKSGSLRGGAR